MNRKTAPYGTFRSYPKIRIYNRKTGEYICSTTWARTCVEAVQAFVASAAAEAGAQQYFARFVKAGQSADHYRKT